MQQGNSAKIRLAVLLCSYTYVEYAGCVPETGPINRSTDRLARVGAVFAVPVEQLKRHPDNPRRDLGDLTELAESIKKYGVLQPVLAERTHDGRFRLRFGQRRVAATRKAGLTDVPTLVVPEGLPDDQLVTAMVENLHGPGCLSAPSGTHPR